MNEETKRLRQIVMIVIFLTKKYHLV